MRQLLEARMAHVRHDPVFAACFEAVAAAAQQDAAAANDLGKREAAAVMQPVAERVVELEKTIEQQQEKLDQSIEQLEQTQEQLASFQDMAKSLEEICEVAESCPASPAPWFTDPGFDMPFSLPSIAGDDEVAKKPIGEIMVEDLQKYSFDTIRDKYQAQVPTLGSISECETIGGSCHGGGCWGYS